MAFSNDRWRLFRDVGPWRAWYYEASGDTVTATGYFNEKWQDLRVNDVIYVETAADVPQYRVSAIAPNSVTVTSYGGGSGGGGGDAASVTFTPAGNLAATDVQAALEELDSEKAAASHTQAASTITDFTEASQDVIGAMITAAGGSYNDGAGTITLPSGGSADDYELVPTSPASNPSSPYTLPDSAGNATTKITALAGNLTINKPSTISPTSNVRYWRIVQIAATGADRTITWGTGISLGLGVAPSLVVPSGGTNTYALYTDDGGTTWLYDGDFDISKLTTKSTPVSGDFLLGMDSAASNVMKKFAAPLAASETVAGLIEIGTAAEINTGTDAGRAVGIDQLAASDFGIRYVEVPLFGPTEDAATGDGKAYLHIPPGLNGMNIVYVHAFNVTAGTTGTQDIQIARIRSGTPADVLSTKLTIDSTEIGSDTAATAAVINASNDDVATNDILRFDSDAVQSTAGKGTVVTVGFRKP